MMEDYLDIDALKALHSHYDIRCGELELYIRNLTSFREKPNPLVYFKDDYGVETYFKLEKDVIDLQIDRYEKARNRCRQRANAFLDEAARLANYKPEEI